MVNIEISKCVMYLQNAIQINKSNTTIVNNFLSYQGLKCIFKTIILFYVT